MSKEVTKEVAKSHKCPAIGDTVFFYKDVQDITGVKPKKCFPAIVLEPSANAGNFKTSDMALDLHIFTCGGGGGNETKKGVIYSEIPMPGRWSFKK